MSELFPKVRMIQIDPAAVEKQGGDKKIIEAVKRHLDDQILQRSKEVDLRNSLEKNRRRP